MAEAHAGRGVVRMAMYLQDTTDIESRRLAIEHWHRSLELNPNQPKLRELIAKYKLPEDDQTAAILLGTSEEE